MKARRPLVVVADDFGIGPETTRGILDLAAEGRISATVLLVNSPHAESAVAAWNRIHRPVEVGWHPCLTLDRPILPADRVPSLVDADGSFPSLGGFIRRVCTGRVRAGEDHGTESARDSIGHGAARLFIGKFPSVMCAFRVVTVWRRTWRSTRAKRQWSAEFSTSM